MPPPPPSLPDELLEEVFLHLPSDEPAFLARASLVSKLWLGLLSGPRFRRRYGEFHGAPPMLGFLYYWPHSMLSNYKDPVANFVSTTKFAARIPDDHEYAPWDCRHGRVLLGSYSRKNVALIVWDPMTGRRMKLEAPGNHGLSAVFCAVTGCDHRACHDGPFRVLFVSLGGGSDGCVAHARVSSPATAEWSEQCSGLHLPAYAFLSGMAPVLVESAFYFMLLYGDLSLGILQYDLSSNCLSLIDTPLEMIFARGAAILMAMADGGLGFVHVDRFNLCVWSRQMGSDGVASWTQHLILDLNNLFPIQNPKKKLRLVGSVEGGDNIFVTTDLGIYEINLKSLQWKKIWKRDKFHALIPYMSFYTPQGLQNDADKKNLLEGSSALQQRVVRAHDAVCAASTDGLPRIMEAGEEDLES